MNADCGREDLRIALGAYVLDALDPDEAGEVRRHLTTCAECTQEYDSLRGVRTMLDVGLVGGLAGIEQRRAAAAARVGAGAAGVVAGSRDVAGARDVRGARGLRGARGARGDAGRPLAGAVRVRRRKFTLALAGAATAVATALGVGVFALVNEGTTVATAQSRTVTGASGAIQASIEYRDVPWGTSLQITMSHVPADYDCTLTVVDKNGHTQFASSWQSRQDGGTVTVPGGVAMRVSDIAYFDLDFGQGADLTIPVAQPA